MPIAQIIFATNEGIGCQWFPDKGASRRTETLRWEAIESVEAFKRDILAYDLICIQISMIDGSFFEFDEQDSQWQILTDALPRHLPGCMTSSDWWNRVALPPFETNFLTIYERTRG